MKYIQTYEKFENDPFYKDPMYYIELRINGNGNFTLEQTIILKHLIEIFNEKEIEYRVYFWNNCSVVFLFNKNPKYELPPTYDDIDISDIELKHLKNMEKYRILDNDVELFFDAKKYNI